MNQHLDSKAAEAAAGKMRFERDRELGPKMARFYKFIWHYYNHRDPHEMAAVVEAYDDWAIDQAAPGKPGRDKRALRFADRTRDAYSADRYSREGWTDCASLLLEYGCTGDQAEMYLRSKNMRWAADSYDSSRDDIETTDDLWGKHGRETLEHYLQPRIGSKQTPKQILHDQIRYLEREVA